MKTVACFIIAIVFWVLGIIGMAMDKDNVVNCAFTLATIWWVGFLILGEVEKDKE